VILFNHFLNDVILVLAPNKKIKKMYMHERILLHQYDGDSSDLAEFIRSPVPFKIVVTDEDKVKKFPEVFELGLPEYAYSVDVLMRHELVGDSEVTAVVRDLLMLLPSASYPKLLLVSLTVVQLPGMLAAW